VPKEKVRINRAKGDVRHAKSNGGIGETQNIMRVYFKGRDGPGLAMSRSIGDTDAHSIGVIEKPGKILGIIFNYIYRCSSFKT
jgi:hypothetical protein